MIVRKLYSVFLLLTLLVPAVQREIHTFHHKDDISCSANDTKHLHEQHHYCKFCDFSVPAHFTSVHSFVYDAQDVITQNLILPSPSEYVAFHVNHGPPRAPPFGSFLIG